MLERAAVAPRTHAKGPPRAEHRRFARGPRLLLPFLRIERVSTPIHGALPGEFPCDVTGRRRLLKGSWARGPRRRDRRRRCRESGGAKRHAATTGAMVQLDAARQSALALLTAGVAQRHVVRAARAGRFLLRMASATVPNTLSEGCHGRSFLVAGEQLGARGAASQMPLVVVSRCADFTRTTATRTELYYPFLS